MNYSRSLHESRPTKSLLRQRNWPKWLQLILKWYLRHTPRWADSVLLALGMVILYSLILWALIKLR